MDVRAQCSRTARLPMPKSEPPRASYYRCVACWLGSTSPQNAVAVTDSDPHRRRNELTLTDRRGQKAIITKRPWFGFQQNRIDKKNLQERRCANQHKKLSLSNLLIKHNTTKTKYKSNNNYHEDCHYRRSCGWCQCCCSGSSS